MTNMRFPFRRLPNDLCSMVLKTMDPHEMIAYSLTSKKALSLVQSLGLPLRKALISMSYWPEIRLDFRQIDVQFAWELGDDGEEMASLNDLPVKVNVSVQYTDDATVFRQIIKSTEFTWKNQKKSLGEWVKHICSIFRYESYEANFYMRGILFDIPTLRNNFPELIRVLINCLSMGPSEDDEQSAQNVLRAFLPHAKHFQLIGVPLQEDVSIQHIGMANLTELEIFYPQNPKLDDLLTLNAERCKILENPFSLRDLNRFFKLWTKGSNPRLKFLWVHGIIGNIPACDVLLKGLQAEGSERETEYTIQNCHGIRARIKMVNNVDIGFVSVELTVSK
ncbi:unnamed protein product [Caenorhabditis nigoni]